MTAPCLDRRVCPALQLGKRPPRSSPDGVMLHAARVGPRLEHAAISGDSADTPLGPGIAECDAGGSVKVDVNHNHCVRPIPTVSEWGLIVMTLLLLTAGTIVIRRVKTRQPTVAGA